MPTFQYKKLVCNNIPGWHGERGHTMNKRDRSGDFMDGHYVETVHMPDDSDKWVKYCREYPEKYPEVI